MSALMVATKARSPRSLSQVSLTALVQANQRILNRTRWVAGCRIFTGYTRSTGYGSVHVNRMVISVHRVIWVYWHGPIFDGLHILHHCDNRACVNINHLWAGTHAENMRDRDTKGRLAAGERNAFAKLTWDKVAEMRTRAAKGESVTALGRRFGVHYTTVSNILAGRAWKEKQR